jgi:hypothetical protein
MKNWRGLSEFGEGSGRVEMTRREILQAGAAGACWFKWDMLASRLASAGGKVSDLGPVDAIT